MIYRRARRRSSHAAGFYRFEDEHRRSLHGFGDGDFVRLRDEFGNVWHGQAEYDDQGAVRFLFRDAAGKRISGITDAHGILLRDENGNTWRGYVD